MAVPDEGRVPDQARHVPLHDGRADTRPRARIQPLVRARPLLCRMHGRPVAVRRRSFRRDPAPQGPPLPHRDRHDARPVDRVVPRDLLGARRSSRRVEPLGGRPGELAPRERAHVRGAPARPHAPVRERVEQAARPERLHHRARARQGVPGARRRVRRREGRAHPRGGRRLVPGHVPPGGDAAATGAPSSSSSSTTLPLLDDRPSDVVAPAAGPTRSSSSTSSTTTPPRAGPTATPRSATPSTPAASPPTCGPAPFINTVWGTDTYTDELW